jgi:hypothetical protein
LTLLAGYSLVIRTNIDKPYEIRDEVFSETSVLAETTGAEVGAALSRIYISCFRLTGYPRPPNLLEFPPPTGH